MKTDTFLVPFDGSFKIEQSPTAADHSDLSDSKAKSALKKANKKLYELQRTLYAHDKYSVLLIFQAMDAAGKDSTIRTVMRGVNPAGCQVFSFKQPSKEELDHDFLWRSAKRVPERGRIGIFNRSYYEEVLVVKVHPEYLSGQKLPEDTNLDTIWDDRYHSIREHERHLAANGTKIVKFWLNVSKEQQKQRFLRRLQDSQKNWKFSKTDVQERGHWDSYMAAYEDALNETSREYAPWYAIPADNKPLARLYVANIIIDTLQNLGCHYPEAPAQHQQMFEEMEKLLLNE